MNHKRLSTVLKRIENNDCTIVESDFFAPPDGRNIKFYENKLYYDYLEDFNKLGELEGFFENDF